MRKITGLVLLALMLSACGDDGTSTEPQDHQYVEWDVADTSQWQANVHDFEHLMTMTAVLTVDGDTVSSAENRIVAYSDNSVRSNAVSYEHLGQRLYALNLYSSNLTDTLHFAAWIDDLGMAVMIENIVPFEANAALGTPDSPYDLVIE